MNLTDSSVSSRVTTFLSLRVWNGILYRTCLRYNTFTGGFLNNPYGLITPQTPNQYDHNLFRIKGNCLKSESLDSWTLPIVRNSKYLDKTKFRKLDLYPCKIWGLHGGRDEEFRLLGCDAVWLLLEPTLRRNKSPPSSGWIVFLLSVLQLLVTANFTSSLILLTLMKMMKETICSSETLVLTRATRRNITEDGILHSHRSENLKSDIEPRVHFLKRWIF
jgi:hypothetical protein